MSFEQIVRPFQRPDFVATKRVVAHAEKVEVSPAIITWGAAGSLPTAREVEQLGSGFEVKEVKKEEKQHVEVTRETEKVRIENPDDPSQYVIVERIKSIKFKEQAAPIYKTEPPRAQQVTSSSTTYGTQKTTTSYAPQPGDPAEVPLVVDPREESIDGADATEIPLQVDTREYVLNTQ